MCLPLPFFFAAAILGAAKRAKKQPNPFACLSLSRLHGSKVLPTFSERSLRRLFYIQGTVPLAVITILSSSLFFEGNTPVRNCCVPLSYLTGFLPSSL